MKGDLGSGGEFGKESVIVSLKKQSKLTITNARKDKKQTEINVLVYQVAQLC